MVGVDGVMVTFRHCHVTLPAAVTAPVEAREAMRDATKKEPS